MRKGDYFFLIVLTLLIIAFVFSLQPKQEPNHCNNTILDKGEIHVDCGGECLACSEKYPHYFSSQHRNLISISSIIIIFFSTLFGILYLKRHQMNSNKQIIYLIKEAEDILEYNLPKAVYLYQEIKFLFSKLKPEEKKELYSKAFGLHNKIKKKLNKTTKKN